MVLFQTVLNLLQKLMKMILIQTMAKNYIKFDKYQKYLFVSVIWCDKAVFRAASDIQSVIKLHLKLCQTFQGMAKFISICARYLKV